MSGKLSQHGAIGPADTKQYTLQEAIDHVGFGRFQVKVTFITGVVMMCEGMGVAILTLLGPILHCQFRLTPLQQAAIPAVAMLGMMLSSPLLGKMSDQYGRKWVLILTTILMGYFKILASLSPNVYWIYITMFLTGTSFGGTVQSITLCSEYIPTKYRQHSLLFIDGMFGAAGILSNLLAKVIVPSIGWRWLLVTSSLCELIFISVVYVLPESARYMLVSGRHKEAQRLLDSIARQNNSFLPGGSLSPADDKTMTRLGTVSDLFSRKVLPTSLAMSSLWFSSGLVYIGISILIPTVFMTADGCHGSDVTYAQIVGDCRVGCQDLTDSDFTSLVVSSVGELAGPPVTLLVISLLSRRASLLLFNFFQALTSFISIICMPRIAITLVMFLTRTCGVSLFAVMMLFSVEVFPTTCRSVGMGVGITFYKLGCIVAPAVGQVLASYKISLSFLVFGLVGVFGMIASYLTPVETKNKVLKDTGWQ